MSNKRIYVPLTPEREKMLDILAKEMTDVYNSRGIAFGGQQDVRNAVILRLVLEGFRKYGFTKSDEQLYWDDQVFYKAMNYNPNKTAVSLHEEQK